MDISDAEYEIDFLLFHPILGVMICETKTTNTLENLEKGKKQLHTRKMELPKLYAAVTGDEVSSFPPISLIIFAPRISDEAFLNSALSSNDIEFELIGKDTLQDEHKLTEFWSRKISESIISSCFTSENLHAFVAIIATYRSSIYVSVAENTMHVYERIQGQLQLEKQRPSDTNVINYTSISSKSDKIVFNKEQLMALNLTDNCQIIYGPPGSGKTLVLQMKACRISKTYPNSRICISSNYHHAQEIKEFVYKNNGKTGNQHQIVIVDDLNENIVKSDDHLFADEVGFSKFSFWKTRSNCKGTTTVIMTLRLYITDIENFGIEERIHKAFPSYKAFHLQTILRGTKEIICYWFPALRSQMRKREEEKDKRGNKNGTNDSQHNEPQIVMLPEDFAVGHSITGISVVQHKELTIAAVMERIKMELDILLLRGRRKKKRNTLSLLDVAVLCDSKIMTRRVTAFLENTKYKCGTVQDKVFEEQPLLVVDEFVQALSFEWPIVLSVSMVCSDTRNSFSLLAASRAIGHLIVIERDYMKIQQDFDSGIENLSDSLKMFLFDGITIINSIESDIFTNRFDLGVALLRNNFLPYDLSKWAKLTFNIVHCANMCEFIKEMMKNENLFDCFVFRANSSSWKIECAINNFSKMNNSVFKFIVNERAKILQLLNNKSLQLNLICKFASFWCNQVHDKFVPLGRFFKSCKVGVNNEMGRLEYAPNSWLSLVTALDQLLLATCDVWYEELLDCPDVHHLEECEYPQEDRQRQSFAGCQMNENKSDVNNIIQELNEKMNANFELLKEEVGSLANRVTEFNNSNRTLHQRLDELQGTTMGLTAKNKLLKEALLRSNISNDGAIATQQC